MNSSKLWYLKMFHVVGRKGIPQSLNYGLIFLQRNGNGRNSVEAVECEKAQYLRSSLSMNVYFHSQLLINLALSVLFKCTFRCVSSYQNLKSNHLYTFSCKRLFFIFFILCAFLFYFI